MPEARSRTRSATGSSWNILWTQFKVDRTGQTVRRNSTEILSSSKRLVDSRRNPEIVVLDPPLWTQTHLDGARLSILGCIFQVQFTAKSGNGNQGSGRQSPRKTTSRAAQFSVPKGDHFHLEQPQGSELPDQDEVAELRYGTLKALFDMCQLGHLRLPADTKYLRKRTQLRTTSRIMHQGIHKQLCQGQHEHQHIAGQANINGTTQNISTYAGKYTNRFAKNCCQTDSS